MVKMAMEMLTWGIKKLLNKYGRRLADWRIKNPFVTSGLWQLHASEKMSQYRNEEGKENE